MLVIAIYGCCFHLSTMQNSWSISIENVARIKGLEAFCRILKGFCGVLRADLRLWIHPLRWRWLVDVVVDYSIIFWFVDCLVYFPIGLSLMNFVDGERWTVNSLAKQENVDGERLILFLKFHCRIGVGTFIFFKNRFKNWRF